MSSLDIIIKSATALQCFWAIELDIMQLMCSASYGLTGNNDALDILITPGLLIKSSLLGRNNNNY